MRVVAGRLKNDYRYAPSVYYNFPMPTTTEEQKQRIEHTAQAIIDARKIYQRPDDLTGKALLICMVKICISIQSC